MKKALVLFLILALFLSSCTTNLAGLARKIKPQCNDRIDNDGDGFCDFTGCNIGSGRNKVKYPPDTDCLSEKDNIEGPKCSSDRDAKWGQYQYFVKGSIEGNSDTCIGCDESFCFEDS